MNSPWEGLVLMETEKHCRPCYIDTLLLSALELSEYLVYTSWKTHVDTG